MKFINDEKLITNDQLIQIINLLPGRYKKLDTEIIFISRKIDVFKYIKFDLPFFAKVFLEKPYSISGTTTNDNKILIMEYEFSIGNKSDQYPYEMAGLAKLDCLSVILHEIRHIFQYTYVKDKAKMYMLNKKYERHTSHDDRWEEKDAYKFSNDFLCHHCDEIMNILSKVKYNPKNEGKILFPRQCMKSYF